MSTSTLPVNGGVENVPEQTNETSDLTENISDIPDVIDLKEFALALRTFPETILKTMLDIYHEQEKKKKQEERSKATLTANKKTKEEINKDLFPLTNNYLKKKTTPLPTCLLREYDHPNVLNDIRSLEPHLQYAYSHLYERTTTEIIRDNQYVRQDLDEETDAKARMDSKSNNNGRLQTPTGISSSNARISPNGTPSPVQNGTLKNEEDGNLDENQPSRNSVHFADQTEGAYNNRMSVARISESISDEYFDLIDPELIYDEISKRIMSIYQPSFSYEPLEQSEIVDRQVAMPPFIPNAFEQKLLFTLQNFKLDVGRLEPLFVTIYLFDTQKNCKISENYYYVVNTDQKGTSFMHKMKLTYT
jgi:hypothetical protein